MIRNPKNPTKPSTLHTRRVLKDLQETYQRKGQAQGPKGTYSQSKILTPFNTKNTNIEVGNQVAEVGTVKGEN